MISKLFLSLFLIALCHQLAALSIETGSMRGFLYGSEPACAYDNWLSHVSENIANEGFNQYALWDRQTPGFGSFLNMPDSLLTPWTEVLNLYALQDFSSAQNMLQASAMPFNIILFSDLDSGREYYIMRENLNQDYDDNGSPELWDDENGSFDFGWGLYVFNPSATNPIIVTAPHPCDDYPSTMMALEAFEKLNARYLLINGAGREVAYYGTQYQSNNSSLSDPSRNPDHPYNVAYHRFADEIRLTFGRMEFSLQVHTYDWASQQNQASVQLSAGNGRYFPCLPIRDWSRRKLDLIHQAPYEVHPAGSIGDNNAVFIDDYYSVYYGSSSPVYYTRDGYNIQLSNNQDYPGSMQNQQMLYTEPLYNSQTFSPFMHVEMDELPQIFEQTEERLKWFYGWDADAGAWIPAERFSKFRQFYMRWIDDLARVVPEMLILDDRELPSDPVNLSTSGNNYQLSVNWERSYAYDFETYQLEVSYLSGDVPVVDTLQQSDYADLGRQNKQSFSFSYGYLPTGTLFSFRIRARDLQGNLSAWSNSATASSSSTLITQVSATEYPERIRINWSGTSSQTGNIRGAVIRRSLDGVNFTVYDSWESNPALIIPGQASGFYDDSHVLQGTAYYYKVSVVLQSGYEHLDYRIVKGSPYRSYPLNVTNLSTGYQSSFAFGEKVFGTDAPDLGVDIRYTGNPTLSPLLLLSIPEGQEEYYSKDIRAHFDPSETQKSYQLELWTSAANCFYSFSFGDSVSAIAGSLILRDDETWTWYNLLSDPVTISIPSSGPHSFTLLWGYMEPYLTVNGASDLFVSQGNLLNFDCLVQPAFLVQNIDLSIEGDGLELSLFTGLPPTLTSFEYNLLDDLSPRTGRLKLVAHCVDGSVVEAYSRYQIHFISNSYIVSGEPGRRLLSFPTTSLYSTVMDVFGSVGDFWTWDESGAWRATEELVFNRPYLAVFNTDYGCSLPNLPMPEAVPRSLQPGWNFVANPHQMDYPIKDISLLFTSDLMLLSYPWLWLVQRGWVDPYIWVIRDGALQTDTVLRQGESCFIRNYSEHSLGLPFYPGDGSGPWMEASDEWNILLSVRDSRGLAAAVRIGSSESGSEGFDAGLDIPCSELPAIPENGPRLAILPREATPGTMLFCDYKGLYPDSDTVSKSWTLGLDQSGSGPLNFMIECDRLPDSYRVSLNLEGQSHVLLPGETLSWAPSQAGMVNAVLTISSNVPVANQDLTQSNLRLKIYPNPFRDEIKLELPVSKDPQLRLAIYNLRGQLVRELFKGPNATRKTIAWDSRDAHGNKCAAGVYLVQVADSKTKLRQKILKF